jgi:hypothetical protein
MIGEKIWRVKLQQKNQFGKPSQQKKNKDQTWEIKKLKENEFENNFQF